MDLARKYLKTVALAALGAATLLALSLALLTPPPAGAATATCPKFRVVHNDQIGQIKFPSGYYAVTVLNRNKLACGQVPRLFNEFLQDADGKLRSPWVLRQRYQDRIFSAGARSDRGFRVRPSKSGGGGGGGTRTSCPGYFTVVHNDSIGSFKVPHGKYRLTLLDSMKMDCDQAVKKFRTFLLDFDGKLPWPWKLNQSNATFYKSTDPGTGFNINRAYGPSPDPSKDKKFARCPGTFRVLHNDRIGQLRLPKGPYYIYTGMKGGLPCATASNWFRTFLNRPAGDLPSPWSLDPNQALFTNRKNGRKFRVQRA